MMMLMSCQLIGEKEVLAQVKMSFMNTKNIKMVVSRRLQVTVKKNARTQKALECSLESFANGERHSISSRVAQLDQIVPQYLGVSRAVLECVIFCHQDESLWPMSEPSVLKKKFDEIFEASKYTKAIDNLKDMRKIKGNELISLKILEAQSKDNKDKGDQEEQEAKALHAELVVLREDITKLHTETKQAGEKFNEASDRAAEYASEVTSLENHHEKHDWLQRRVQSLGKDLEKRKESDDWLQSELDRFDERISEHQQQERRLLNQYEDLDIDMRKIESKQAKKIKEAGKYEEQKSSHERQVERRKSLIKETSQKHKIRGYDGELDDVQIKQYIDKVSRLAADQSRAMEKMRRETESEMQKEQDVLNKLGEQKSAFKENRTTTKQQHASNEQNMTLGQLELKQIGVDEAEKTVLRANIEDLQARLTSAREESKKANWDSKINECNVRKRALEEESKQLKNELVESTQKAGELAQLDALRREIDQCNKKLDTMQGVHDAKLQKLVSHKWDPPNLDSQYQKVLDIKSDAVKDAERQRETVTRRLEQVEYKLSTTKHELQRAEKELATSVKHLHDNVDGEPQDYTETLLELQQTRDQYKADYDNFGNLQKYYTSAIKRARANHDCKLCQRHFHGEEQITTFTKSVEEKMKKETAEQVAQDLKDAEDDLHKAKEAGPSYDTWLRNSNSGLPRFKSEIKHLGEDKEEMLRQIEGHDKHVAECEEAKADLELLAKPIALITRYHQDRTGNAAKLEGLLTMQNVSGSSRTASDISKELDFVDDKIKVAESEITKTRADESRARSLMSTLDLQLSKAEQGFSTASYQLEKKDAISKRVEELRIQNQGFRDKMKQLDAQLHQLTQEMAEEEARMEDIRQRGKDKERGMQQDALKITDTVQKLEMAAQSIAVYVDAGGSNNLARCRRELGNIDLEISSSKSEQRQVTIAINKIKEESSNQLANKRIISDNIEYRKALQELEGVESEIARLSAQNAEHDRDYWQTERQKWGRIFDEQTMQKTSKKATAKVKDDQLAKLIKSWEINYANAAKEYKEAHIKVEVRRGS